MRRRIDVEGCHNFRDLGGYPTETGGRLRWRLLFRADGLHGLTPVGVATLRDELRLGAVVDLRSSTELALDGRGLLADEPIPFHHVPLFDGGDAARRERPAGLSLPDLYFAMLEHAREPLSRVLVTLARTEAPAVFHCAAGKDRTGVVSALLLSLLGVPEELVVVDYAASRDALDAVVGRLLASEGYRELLAELPPDTLHAEPETMVRFLGRLRDAYGGAEGYARAIGVGEEDVARLRSRLVRHEEGDEDDRNGAE